MLLSNFRCQIYNAFRHIFCHLQILYFQLAYVENFTDFQEFKRINIALYLLNEVYEQGDKVNTL